MGKDKMRGHRSTINPVTDTVNHFQNIVQMNTLIQEDHCINPAVVIHYWFS